MPAQLPFTKLQALSNDFILIDAIAAPTLAARPDLAALARSMCDRRTGVGADGLILAAPPARDDADVRMLLFNADGSSAQMSGNGVRCLARFLDERGHPMRTRDQLAVETARHIVTVHLHRDARKRVVASTVDMGEPALEASRIPVASPTISLTARVIDAPLADQLTSDPEPANQMRAAGVHPRMTCVSMGNPHLVLFCEAIERVPVATLGAFFERRPIFPERTNVQFAQVTDRSTLHLRTWERGAGVTLACGTGSCAAVVAAALTGRLDREATVHMRGGDLRVRWDKATNRVHLTGPAEVVFEGVWREPAREASVAGQRR